MPGYRVEGYDQSISQCRGAVERVGKELGLPVVSIRVAAGERRIERKSVAAQRRRICQLRQRNRRSTGRWPTVRDIRARVAPIDRRKDQLFFHRYRPQNETYLFLFRKHEQGNNAVEIPQFDPLIQGSGRSDLEGSVEIGIVGALAGRLVVRSNPIHRVFMRSNRMNTVTTSNP